MARLFADLPEAIDNTVEIALRCSYYPKTAIRSCRASPAAMSPTTMPPCRRKPTNWRAGA